MKPDSYPLPWNDKYDLAYWQINLMLCFYLPGWRSHQAYRPMSELIPELDQVPELDQIIKQA